MVVWGGGGGGLYVFVGGRGEVGGGCECVYVCEGKKVVSGFN